MNKTLTENKNNRAEHLFKNNNSDNFFLGVKVQLTADI